MRAMIEQEPLVSCGFGKVADAFRATIPDEDRSGASLSVWVDGTPAVELWGGVADARDGRRFGPDTPSVIFSCTKGIATVLIGMLIECGVVPPLETPVVEIWPAFGAHGKDELTIGDLLAHRGGVSAPRRDLTLREALDDLAVADVLADQEPLWSPGKQHQYHAVTHGALTAKLVERTTGRLIGSCFASRVARPLQAEVWIGLPEAEEPRVAPLVADTSAPAAPQSDVDAEALRWVQRAADFGGVLSPPLYNQPILHRAGLAGAGGIATATGLARIWSATVVESNGVRLINDDTVDALRQVRSEGPSRFVVGPPPYQSWGAGLMVPSDWQRYLSPNSFGHDGAGGQVAFADIDAKLGFAYLTTQMGGWERGQSVVRAVARALG